jgi:hypothetical protein
VPLFMLDHKRKPIRLIYPSRPKVSQYGKNDDRKFIVSISSRKVKMYQPHTSTGHTASITFCIEQQNRQTNTPAAIKIRFGQNQQEYRDNQQCRQTQGLYYAFRMIRHSLPRLHFAAVFCFEVERNNANKIN